MTLQDRINKLFSDNPGTTNAELARYIGIEPPSITKWRKGTTEALSAHCAVGIARFFKVDVEWVVDGDKKYASPLLQEALSIIRRMPNDDVEAILPMLRALLEKHKDKKAVDKNVSLR